MKPSPFPLSQLLLVLGMVLCQWGLADPVAAMIDCDLQPRAPICQGIPEPGPDGADNPPPVPTPRPPVPTPRILRVGVFNMNNPALRVVSWDERMAILKRWGGELFSKADIVLISELGSPSAWPWDWWNDFYLKVLSEASGLAFYQAGFKGFVVDATWPDVGILSRYPIQGTPEVHPLPEAKRLLDVVLDIQYRPHRVLVTHFTSLGPAPGLTNPVRIESASKVIALVGNETIPLIFGGDLNTCAPAPSLCGEDQARGEEYELIRSQGRLVDSFAEIAGAEHCSDARIDYLFYRGPYHVMKYETCSFNNAPSDHPYVLVTLEATN